MLKLILITLVFSIMFFIIQKLKPKSEYLYNVLKIILISIMVEVYIFNINSFRTTIKKYDVKEYSNNELIVTGAEQNQSDGLYTFENKVICIEIPNIKTKVATIKLDIDLIEESDLTYRINYTDKTSKNYRGLIEKSILSGINKISAGRIPKYT